MVSSTCARKVNPPLRRSLGQTPALGQCQEAHLASQPTSPRHWFRVIGATAPTGPLTARNSSRVSQETCKIPQMFWKYYAQRKRFRNRSNFSLCNGFQPIPAYSHPFQAYAYTPHTHNCVATHAWRETCLPEERSSSTASLEPPLARPMHKGTHRLSRPRNLAPEHHTKVTFTILWGGALKRPRDLPMASAASPKQVKHPGCGRTAAL